VVFQSYSVIKADAAVAEHAVVHYCGGKSNNPPSLSPKKKYCAIIHALAEFAKVGLGQFLKSKFVVDTS
jgi:hypothetical protein